MTLAIGVGDTTSARSGLRDCTFERRECDVPARAEDPPVQIENSSRCAGSRTRAGFLDITAPKASQEQRPRPMCPEVELVEFPRQGGAIPLDKPFAVKSELRQTSHVTPAERAPRGDEDPQRQIPTTRTRVRIRRHA